MPLMHLLPLPQALQTLEALEALEASRLPRHGTKYRQTLSIQLKVTVVARRPALLRMEH